jgi:transposase
LFVGGGEPGHRAATIYTVISSARRHELDIWAYLRDVLDHLAKEDVDLDALLPDRWKQSHPEHVHIFRIREREAQATARQERRRRQRAFHRAKSR